MFLLQSGNLCNDEKRAIKNNSNDYIGMTYDDLKNNTSDDLKKYIPIGSVEFCELLLNKINKPIPKHITYPDCLNSFYKRDIKKDLYKNVSNGYFVKPVEKIKLFTGFIKGESPIDELPENIDDILVYYTDKINFWAEYRYYICENKILGYSRYDDSDIEYDDPNIKHIQRAINSFINPPVAYSMDFGLNDKKNIILIEINDAWALGYYKWGNMTELSYINMIEKRWKQIINE